MALAEILPFTDNEQVVIMDLEGMVRLRGDASNPALSACVREQEAEALRVRLTEPTERRARARDFAPRPAQAGSTRTSCVRTCLARAPCGDSHRANLSCSTT